MRVGSDTVSLEEMTAAGIWIRGNGRPIATDIDIHKEVMEFLALAEKVKLKMLERASRV